MSLGLIWSFDLYRQSRITLKCDQSEPGKSAIANFTETVTSPSTSTYVIIYVMTFAARILYVFVIDAVA